MENVLYGRLLGAAQWVKISAKGSNAVRGPTDEVFQVEEHGTDPIPESERGGGAGDLFWRPRRRP
jgi:hypothetical protein